MTQCTNDYLASIGLTSDMCIQMLAVQLRTLVVQEWRGDAVDEYVNFYRMT